MKRQKIDGAFCRALRLKLHLNQTDFWQPVGVTQSGGCRYESGRDMPAPVRKLIWLVYLAGADVDLLDRLQRI